MVHPEAPERVVLKVKLVHKVELVLLVLVGPMDQLEHRGMLAQLEPKVTQEKMVVQVLVEPSVKLVKWDPQVTSVIPVLKAQPDLRVQPVLKDLKVKQVPMARPVLKDLQDIKATQALMAKQDL